MEFRSQAKFVKMSPRKLRLVSDAVVRFTPTQALTYLSFMSKAASLPLSKVIKSAVANARNASVGVSEENLRFKKIEIGSGPILKRGRAVSRGAWHPLKKRTSHITVILESQEVAGQEKKVPGENSSKPEGKEKNGTKS